jgi:transposase-like protein
MELLKEGLTPVEVARRVGVDRRSVRRWKAAHRQKGRQALLGQAAETGARAKLGVVRLGSRGPGQPAK